MDQNNVHKNSLAVAEALTPNKPNKPNHKNIVSAEQLNRLIAVMYLNNVPIFTIHNISLVFTSNVRTLPLCSDPAE